VQGANSPSVSVLAQCSSVCHCISSSQRNRVVINTPHFFSLSLALNVSVPQTVQRSVQTATDSADLPQLLSDIEQAK
jgi:hypothetical protein